MPEAVRPFRNVHRPMSTVTRYVAIGLLSSQTKLARPPAVVRETRSPLATTAVPSGTLTRKVYVALSVGWSFAGNQVLAALGSSPTNAPSLVYCHPYAAP